MSRNKFNVVICVVGLVAISLRLLPTFLGSIERGDPDSTAYEQLSQGLRAGCGFARLVHDKCEAPELLRTPGYPFFLMLFNDERASLVIQSIGGGLLCLVIGVFAAKHFGSHAGICAGALLTLDGPSIVTSGMYLSDVLFSIAVAAWFLMEIEGLLSMTGKRATTLIFTSSMFLTAAILVRPIGLSLIPVAIVAPILREGRLRDRTRTVFLAVALPVFVVMTWTERNAIRTGIRSFSVIEEINLYYFRAAGVYSNRFGISFSDAQRELGKSAGVSLDEIILPETWSSRQAALPLQKRLRNQGFKIISEYPSSLVLVTLESLIYVSLAPERSGLARLLGEGGWHSSPSFEPTIWRFRSTIKEILVSPWVTGLVGLQILLTSFTWFGVGLAIKRYVRDEDASDRLVIAFLLACVFCLLVPAAGPEAHPRYRIPAAPPLVVLAGIGWFCDKSVEFNGANESDQTESKRFP